MFLLENGANICAKDKSGTPPYQKMGENCKWSEHFWYLLKNANLLEVFMDVMKLSEMNSLAKNYMGRNNNQANQQNMNANLPQNQSQGQNGGDNFTTAQKNINASILEYLLKYGFMKTVDCFQVSY